MQVQVPDKDDWDKLCQQMKCLKSKRHSRLKLSDDDANIAKWHVDALHAVHPDMKSHTGGAMTSGPGCICNASTNKNKKTKSSTELELVGVDDCMPQVTPINEAFKRHKTFKIKIKC